MAKKKVKQIEEDLVVVESAPEKPQDEAKPAEEAEVPGQGEEAVTPALDVQEETQEERMVYLRNENLTDEFPIKDGDRMTYGKSLSNLLHRKASLKLEKKQEIAGFKKREKEIDTDIAAMQRAVDYGRLEQTVPCRVFYDKDTGHIVYEDFDGCELKRRPPAPGEQFPLPKPKEEPRPLCFGPGDMPDDFKKPYEDCDECPHSVACNEALVDQSEEAVGDEAENTEE